MSRYRPEPPFAHDRAPKIGVLLVNLGTPEAPTTVAVRRYLAEFLSDPRVVEIPRIAWTPLLHGLVLRTRPSRSAAKYAAIWTNDGSPLLVHRTRQKGLLSRYLGQRIKKHGRPDRLVLSFHGVPRRSLTAGDPYHCFCHVTGRLLAQEIGLEPKQWALSFQSRFGRGEWLKPYTFDTLAALGREGLPRVDVLCPGFVADCLETLEEIGIAGRRAFQKAGGKELHAIPCLNEQPAWLTALTDLAFRHLAGWLERPPDAAARERTLLRAKVVGAKF